MYSSWQARLDLRWCCPGEIPGCHLAALAVGLRLKREFLMRIVRLLATVVLVLVFGTLVEAQDRAVSKVEAKCASRLGRSAVKVAATTGKELSRCRETDIGGTPASCPDARATEKIDRAKSKAVDGAAKRCRSTCAVDGDIAR